MMEMAADDDGVSKALPPTAALPAVAGGDASSGAAAPADAPEHPLAAAFRFFFIQDNEDEDGHTLGKVRLGVWRVRRRSSSRGRGADDA